MLDFARDDARPTTPTGSATAPKPRLNTNQPQHETFFDDATPVDSSGRTLAQHDPLRDSHHSHDLSFAEGATIRDSVVDNMLLSLDQFSTGSLFGNPGPQYTNHGEDDFFLRDNSYRPPGNRHRGHTYTSSRSSDYDAQPDDPARYAVQHSRARRSNSSNNITSTPVSRKGSTRDVYAGRQQTGPYGQLQQAGHARGAGKKSSKGSGSSSMDFGQSGILGNQRLGFGKRSASFDHSCVSDRPSYAPVKVESVLDRGRVAYQNYADDYDAAPEPTIPAGPRRVQEQSHSPAAYPSQPAYAPPPAPGPHRRGSIRSNTSYRTLRKNKSQPDPTMRAQAQEFVNASILRDLPVVPVVPSFQDPPAPSPTVSTRKPAFPQQAPVATPQQKPGFFRRVFGGGAAKVQPQQASALTTSTTSQTDTPPGSAPRAPDIDSIFSQARPRTTPSNNSHIASQLKPIPRAPQTAVPQKEAQPSAQPALVKKPSSFFRRRKKSMSEPVPMPAMSIDFTPPARPVLPPQPSPGVSSLRKVMNPYLTEADRANDKFDKLSESREQQTAAEAISGERSQRFSPGYKPHKDATVRPVQLNSHGTEETSSSSQLANTGSPRMRLKLKNGKSTHSTHEDTFLADSSSANEDRSGRASPTGQRRSRKLSTGPTSTESGSEGRSDRKAKGEPRTELLSPKDHTTSRSGSVSQSASEVEDDGWVVTEVATTKELQPGVKASAHPKQMWLNTTLLEDKPSDTAEELKLPPEGARSSQVSLNKLSPSPDATTPTSPNDVNEVFHSATSLPIVQVESRESDAMPAIVEDRSMHTEPTDSDRERAFQIYAGDENSALKAQAAALLGDVTLTSTRIRKAFIDLFDWTGFTILAAMRDLCGKLVLKAETQQVDRILMSLSERWCECNTNHGFKAVGKSLIS